VELQLAGTFGVVRDGVRLADGGLRSRKARTLLKLLAVERARLVSVDRITEVLWDGDPPAEPAQHVATLVSRLRRILGSEVIRGGRQGYQLAGSQAIMIDLDEAARLTSHAERELEMAPAVAGTAAERAVEILSPGTALAEEPDAAWAEPARGELRGLLRRARHALAEAAQATGDADLAARVAADAMADDPFDEGAHRLFMSACAAAGERAKALETYARLSFVHYLGRNAGGSRLLVVATVRAESDTETGAALTAVARRVEVGPLGAAAVEQLASRAGQAGLADRILRQTRGHTLFVVEVLRALAEGDSGLPESLRSAVQARVRRLGPEAEHLLRAAAVLGAAVDPAIVAGLGDVPPAAALRHCELALRAGLLVAAGRDFEFANDLIREALYATTPEPTRLAYHQRAADRLTSQPESLARHAAACGDWLRAARALLSAADEAFRRFAVTDSAALATQALEAAERAGDLEVGARARVIRGRAHEGAAAVAAALADFSAGAAAARAAGDQRLEMLALRHLGGDVPVAHGMPTGYCESHLARGLRLAELLGDQAAAADLLARLAIIATNTLRFDRALEYGRRAVAAGRAAGDDQALAAGLDGLKTAHAFLGHAGALADVLDELEPLLRRQGDLFRLQHAVFESAFVPLAAGDWDQAVAATESAIQINRRSGYPHWAAPYVAHLGWLARLRGRDGEAVSLGRRAVRLSEANDHPWGGALACATLGATLLAGGDQAEAIELFERGHAIAGQDGAEAYRLHCLAPLAEATGSPDVLAEASRLLAGATLPDGDAWVLGYEAYLSVARAWLTAGQPEQARAVLAPLLAAVEPVPWVAALAAALWSTAPRSAASVNAPRRGRRWTEAPSWPGSTAWLTSGAKRAPRRATPSAHQPARPRSGSS